MPLFDHFNLVAPYYERVIQIKATDALADLLGLPSEGRLLDAGGGTGRIAQTLVGRAGQIVLADASAGMLRQAAAKPGLIPICSFAEALPFPDESFERVLMVDTLHHVADQRQSAAELWRVLRPGGRAVIEEPDVRRWRVKLLALAEKAALMRSHFLAPQRIAALFDHPDAHVHVVVQDLLAWVVVDKHVSYNRHSTSNGTT